MIIGIKKEIERRDNLSIDLVFQIIENNLSDRIKLIKISDSIFRFKKLYKFQSNGWETIFKNLSINDSGVIDVKEKSIIYTIDLTKQLVVTLLASAVTFVIFWKAFNIELFISLSIVILFVLVIWTFILLEGKHLTKSAINEIGKMIR
ncbi:MAG: hypothetical protein JXA68_05715 [Ignavibacteriales bacterium]|nr:hypothetical protein [Ignavibacteriales bacterium]